MNLQKACCVFDIQNIAEEDKKSIKRRYKALMIKYHPDNCGSDAKAKEIGEAYKIIVDSLENKTKMGGNSCAKGEVLKVTLESIVEAFKKNDKEYINRLSRGNTTVLIDVMTLNDNMWTSKQYSCKYEQYGRYNIYVEYQVKNLVDKIGIRVCDSIYLGELSTGMKVVVLKVSDDVSVTINVSRKLYE